MKKNISLGILLAVILTVLGGIVSFAAYNYYVPISVFNNYTSPYYNLTVVVSINNTQLASLGYINSSGLDTDLVEGAVSRTYSVEGAHIGFLVPSILNEQVRTYHYRLDSIPEQADFPVIVGVTGNFTVDDDPTIELGQAFEMEFKALIDPTVGVDGVCIYKLESFKVYYPTSGTIRAAILDGGDAENITVDAGVGIGLYTIKITLDGVNFKIYVNGVEVDSTAQGYVNVTDNNNNWYFMENSSIIYLDYLKFWTSD